MSSPQTDMIASDIAQIAARVATCTDLDARDRNTAIGMLRNCAALIRGAVGMPGFAQAAYAKTTPTEDNIPNTPPRT